MKEKVLDLLDTFVDFKPVQSERFENRVIQDLPALTTA